MTDSMLNHTPSKLLAQKIVSRFVKSGILPEVYAEYATKLLANGVSKPEDWRLLVEKALELENKGGNDEQQATY